MMEETDAVEVGSEIALMRGERINVESVYC